MLYNSLSLSSKATSNLFACASFNNEYWAVNFLFFMYTIKKPVAIIATNKMKTVMPITTPMVEKP